MAAIEFQDVRAVFRTRDGTVTALAGPDLAVPEGGVFGFLGANGAGKTTAIRAAVGLLRGATVRVTVLGADVPRRLAGRIDDVGGLVEQPPLIGNFSGRRDLELLARTRGIGARRVDATLAQVGLAERADARFATYSLGMKQRLGADHRRRCSSPATSGAWRTVSTRRPGGSDWATRCASPPPSQSSPSSPSSQSSVRCPTRSPSSPSGRRRGSSCSSCSTCCFLIDPAKRPFGFISQYNPMRGLLAVIVDPRGATPMFHNGIRTFAGGVTLTAIWLLVIVALAGVVLAPAEVR